MAAITSAVIGGAGLVMGGIKAIDGAKRSKNAKNELNAYERETLDNAFKDISISTMGSDLLREENTRTSAGLTDALQQSGTRGIIGGIPRVVAATNEINQQAAKMLDDQVQNREYAIAGDNVRIEGMKERRDNDNIGALSSQVDAGRNDMWDGIMGGINAAGSMANSLGGLSSGARQAVDSVSTLNPQAIAPNLGPNTLPTADISGLANSGFRQLSNLKPRGTTYNTRPTANLGGLR